MTFKESFKTGIFIALGMVSVFGVTYAAISWPATPSGETAGGKYMSYLNKILVNTNITTTDGKVKSAASADELSTGGEYISVHITGCNIGGWACAWWDTLNTFVNVSNSKPYSWTTSRNLAPSTFSHNNHGTITVAKSGVYEAYLQTLTQPTSDVTMGVGMVSPYVNGTQTYGDSGTAMDNRWFFKGGYFVKVFGSTMLSLNAGDTVEFWFMPYAALDYMGHNTFTMIRLVRIK